VATPSSTEAAALRERTLGQLRTAHALKSGALRMFGPMLAAVERQRAGHELPAVEDLLARMLDAFGGHRDETERHERELRARVEALGGDLSRPREIGMGAAATLRARLGAVGGQNHGANARDAFVFEHLEIACLSLLESMARRAGDTETADLARLCRTDDEEMASKVTRNWENVLSLMLASDGLDPMRPPEQ